MMKKNGFTIEFVLSSLLVTTFFSNISFGWTNAGNDVSNLFHVCSQTDANRDSKYRSVNGCEGSYIWKIGDVGINGFATVDGYWPRERHPNVINNPPYNLVIPEWLSWQFGSRTGSGVVTYLDGQAFRGEDWLLSVSIPSTIEIYGWGLFAGCKSLNSVTLNCRLISSSMFSGCTSLRHIDIPDGVVTNISRQAFKGSGLVEVSIPGSVGHICENAFANCTNLSSVVINEGVLGIDGRAFAECTSLLSVEIPKSVKSIKQNAFDGCTSMTNLVLHGGVHVCDEAFTSCYSLKTIVVANSDDEVGATVFDGQAFAWCRNLESVFFDGNAPSTGVNIFRGISASTCTVYVHRGSTGWGVDIPGKWNGVSIEYIEDVGLTDTFDVAFSANGGSVDVAKKSVTKGAAYGELPVPTRTGYDFAGWFTAVDGGTSVSADTVADKSVTLYAHWTPIRYAISYVLDGGRNAAGNPAWYTIEMAVSLSAPVRDGYRFKGWTPDGGKIAKGSTGDKTFTATWKQSGGGGSGGGDTPTPISTPTTHLVTFNANGGNVSPTTRTVTRGAAVGTLPTPTRSGYTFGGWFTAANGGAQITGGTKVTANVTYYAQWAEITAGKLNTSFAKAQTVDGALYKGGALAGTMQVKVGKITKKGVVKVSTTASLLVDGKAKKVSAKGVNVALDAMGRVPPVTLAFKAPIGDMAFEMAADGSFTLKNGNYVMVEKKVGGDWSKSGAKVYVDGGRGATALPEGTITELLPDGEPVIPKGGKWSFAKAAGVKYAKDKKTKVSSLVVDTKKGTNRSAMKLTYTPKTGIFKGSFKVYAIQGGKLKKFTVKVIGVVVDGKGTGSATGPNGVRFDVRVE